MTKLGAWKRASAICALSAATAIAARAQTFTTLVDFDGTNGSSPEFMSLVQGVDGRLYGTTLGVSPALQGTVFAIGPEGLDVLHSFCSEGPPCTDGSYPTAGLVLASDGYFYGTTAYGGDPACDCGTIFKIDRRGRSLSTVHNFDTNDGRLPRSSLIQGVDGFFYGTAASGGAVGDGTIFRMSPNGALVVLHSFDRTDGEDSEGGLLESTDGTFYGTTLNGGVGLPACGGIGCGTIFKVTASGKFTLLYSFCSQTNCIDGASPYSRLTEGGDGKFYGTTYGGGEYGLGTVFSITPDGTLTTLYNFCALPHCADGDSPIAGLILGSDGKFYGTTTEESSNGYGTAFSITPTGELTTLYSFCSESCEGFFPFGGLTEGTDGNLYGTTFYGGDAPCPLNAGCGTIFRLKSGLGPFVTFVRAGGKVGQTGPILGQGFTGTTNVAINGIPGTFAVVSDTLIRTTVPPGATTGYVTVTTPSGTLTSNVPFHVIK